MYTNPENERSVLPVISMIPRKLIPRLDLVCKNCGEEGEIHS